MAGDGSIGEAQLLRVDRAITDERTTLSRCWTKREQIGLLGAAPRLPASALMFVECEGS